MCGARWRFRAERTWAPNELLRASHAGCMDGWVWAVRRPEVWTVHGPRGHIERSEQWGSRQGLPSAICIQHDRSTVEPSRKDHRRREEPSVLPRFMLEPSVRAQASDSPNSTGFLLSSFCSPELHFVSGVANLPSTVTFSSHAGCFFFLFDISSWYLTLNLMHNPFFLPPLPSSLSLCHHSCVFSFSCIFVFLWERKGPRNLLF